MSEPSSEEIERIAVALGEAIYGEAAPSNTWVEKPFDWGSGLMQKVDGEIDLRILARLAIIAIKA